MAEHTGVLLQLAYTLPDVDGFIRLNIIVRLIRAGIVDSNTVIMIAISACSVIGGKFVVRRTGNTCPVTATVTASINGMIMISVPTNRITM